MKIDIKKLNLILINKGIKSEDFRKKANISSQTLSNIRKGKSISLDTAIKITRALNINAEDILLLEE